MFPRCISAFSWRAYGQEARRLSQRVSESPRSLGSKTLFQHFRARNACPPRMRCLARRTRMRPLSHAPIEYRIVAGAALCMARAQLLPDRVLSGLRVLSDPNGHEVINKGAWPYTCLSSALAPCTSITTGHSYLPTRPLHAYPHTRLPVCQTCWPPHPLARPSTRPPTYPLTNSLVHITGYLPTRPPACLPAHRHPPTCSPTPPTLPSAFLPDACPPACPAPPRPSPVHGPAATHLC